MHLSIESNSTRRCTNIALAEIYVNESRSALVFSQLNTCCCGQAGSGSDDEELDEDEGEDEEEEEEDEDRPPPKKAKVLFAPFFVPDRYKQLPPVPNAKTPFRPFSG